MSKKMNHYDSQVLEACCLHTAPNCYFIGPFAAYVSFTSQQVRAMDLVSALKASGKLDPVGRRKKKIAVIGAGLAGITATATLLAFGTKVDVFETEDCLHVQGGAYHRIIHPTIARWPTIEPLKHETSYNFFDWIAAPASVISQQLRSHWYDHFVKKYGKRLLNFKVGYDVVGVSPEDPLNPRPNSVKLDVRRIDENGNESDDDQVYEYDLVVSTTGFHLEVDRFGSDGGSYWDVDWISTEYARLELIRSEPSDENRIYVSGCGDGALIDALRIAYKDFRDGWLACELTEHVGPDIEKIISEGEREALLRLKSISCMPKGVEQLQERERNSNDSADSTVRDRANNLMSGRFDTVASKILEQTYEDAFRQLEKDNTAMGKFLEGMGWGKNKPKYPILKIIHPEASPYITSSAPIHKLMMKVAKESKIIDFLPGCIIRDGGKVYYYSRERTDYLIDPKNLIVRHGARPNLAITPHDETGDDRASLRMRQFLLSDNIQFVETPLMRTVVPPNYPEPKHLEPNSKYKKGDVYDFLSVRADLAAAAIEAMYFDKTIRLKKKPVGFIIEETTSKRKPGESSFESRLPEPKSLFGVKLLPTKSGAKRNKMYAAKGV